MTQQIFPMTKLKFTIKYYKLKKQNSSLHFVKLYKMNLTKMPYQGSC